MLDIGPPPDGGRDAWLVVLGCFLHLFCIFGLITSYGQLVPYYITHQLAGYSRSTVSWGGTIQTFMVFGFSVFMGRYFDVHGARTLVISGTALATIALIGLAFSKEFYQILLSHTAFGLSGGIVYSPATAVAGHWFLKRRAEAVGFIVAGSGLGGVVYPIMLKELLERLSFRNTILIIMGFNFVLMLPACFWMKARLPPRRPPPISSLKKPWREGRYVFLCLGTACYAMNIMSPYFNAGVLAQSNKTSPEIVSYAVAILQAGSFVGRIGAGRLADRFGVWLVFGTIPFLTSLTLFAFWVGPVGTAPTIIGLILYGAFSGGWFTLAAAATAAISPIEEIGSRIGMMWNGIAIPMLIGPIVTGRLIETRNNTFMYAGIWTGCTMFLSGCLSVGPIAVAFLRRHARTEAKDDDVETSGTAAPTEETAVSEATVSDPTKLEVPRHIESPLASPAAEKPSRP
ncbi:MFS general substrate transporter [Cutaneotrichosporon oleaginosum]|uniref:MFS general substrate transporter n=1 Tax=Cutaneotrichosporon oleaginosum TaxID=879819 RepID=A0A0J1B3D7_9TREE|nr:MFS general substrate transporter [Cutaneotrichosporon oleaginosum]KLT42144.1 MFS general substrate transporter [Cutaneotrichosporon oleaginosum]TXT11731.1 hypothetical protein COLE_02141 [Cutaneotrichosporon oleaginosum]